MIWAFLEILVPLILAILLGLMIGWLLFRWRRRPLHANEWNQLANNASDAEHELGSVRAAYEEAKNERGVLSGRVASLTTDLDAAQIAVGATTQSNEALARETETLRVELKAIRGEVEVAKDASTSLEEDFQAAQTIISGYVSLEGDNQDLRSEVASSASRIESLEHELASVGTELSEKSIELSNATERIGEVERDAASTALVSTQIDVADTKTTELESALAAARTELDVSQGRIADLDTRLSTTSADLDAAHARVSELEGEIGGAHSQIAGLASLEAELAQAREELAASQRHDGEAESPGEDWRSGETTTLGTAGARHIDDLKVIRGIGPRMEELLNSFGITSWEQLAELDKSDVAAVDDALQEFPGRIERDEWVAQADVLVLEFPDRTNRPTRKTYLKRTKDQDASS